MDAVKVGMEFVRVDKAKMLRSGCNGSHCLAVMTPNLFFHFYLC